MEIMIVNSKIKQKPKTILGRIKNQGSWFYSLLCYCTYYMTEYPIHVTWAQGASIRYASLEELSKKKLWWTIFNSNYTQKFSKLLQWKMCEVFNIWLKRIQRSYLSWKWRVMQNLKKNWLVVRQMTWVIWKIFTRAIESLKIGILMGSFNPK